MSSNPILEELARTVSKVMGVEVAVHEEERGYFVQFGRQAPLGPVDHAQAWYCLLGALGAFGAMLH